MLREVNSGQIDVGPMFGRIAKAQKINTSQITVKFHKVSYAICYNITLRSSALEGDLLIFRSQRR